MSADASTDRPPVWRARIPHLSFRARLALIVNLLLLILVVGFAIVFEQRQRTAIIREVEKRGVVMAEILASTVTGDLVTYNYVSIEQKIRQFGKKPDLVYVMVTDKEGSVAAQFMLDDPLTRLLQQQNKARGTGPSLEQLTLPGTKGDIVYDVVLPVRIEGSNEVWGRVRLGVSLKAMREEIARTRWQIAGFGILALLLGSAATVLLAQRMTRPIQALTEGVAAVGKGDFSRRIEVTTQDELGQLSSAFNAMSDQLARVRDLEERLRRADRLAALGTMAAGIAHDIRNPLTSIQIFCQLVSSRPDDPSVREKFGRIVPRELQRVQAVIEDMMELARPSTLQLEPLDLNEVLTELLELFEEQLTAQKIQASRDLTPDLPPFMGDRKRLHRCLGNFLSNAIQAMPQGGELKMRTSRLEAALLPDPARSGERLAPAIQVRVSDNGVGIPADRLSRIFDPFYTTKEKGLGMGMAIAHRIIEDHKGSVDVESAVGVGTTFTIHFPVHNDLSPTVFAKRPANTAGMTKSQ